MTDYKFKAKERKEKARAARSAGMIPAVVYGKGFSNINVSLEKIGFMRIFKEAGSSNLIDLSVNDKPVKVLVQEVQTDPVSGEVEHVDFYKVDMTKKITTEIPIEFVGTSPLVIEEEGSQIINRDNLEVECLPNDLVDHIEVDVSKITDFEKNIKVSDVKVPDTFEVLSDPDEVVVLIQPPRSEEELEALEEEVVEDVETVEVDADGENAEAEEGEEGEDGEREDKKESEDGNKPESGKDQPKTEKSEDKADSKDKK